MAAEARGRMIKSISLRMLPCRGNMPGKPGHRRETGTLFCRILQNALANRQGWCDDIGMEKTNLKTVKTPRHRRVLKKERICQVVLHNDDVNRAGHVVSCLQVVFAYNLPLAAKIMLEAHERGKAVAEVEAETLAHEHRDQLQAYGLSATVEPV